MQEPSQQTFDKGEMIPVVLIHCMAVKRQICAIRKKGKDAQACDHCFAINPWKSAVTVARSSAHVYFVHFEQVAKDLAFLSVLLD